MSLDGLKDYEQAENLFKKSLKVEFNYFMTYKYYAKMLLKLKRYAEAEDLYLKALKVDPIFHY